MSSEGHMAIDSHADGSVFSGLCSLNESICAGASWSCEHGRFLGLQPPASAHPTVRARMPLYRLRTIVWREYSSTHFCAKLQEDQRGT